MIQLIQTRIKQFRNRLTEFTAIDYYTAWPKQGEFEFHVEERELIKQKMLEAGY